MTNRDFNLHQGFTFSKHIPEEISNFDRVFGIFKDLLTHTSGDIEEAFSWLDMLDKEYDIFTDDYTLEDFEEDLKKRGKVSQSIIDTMDEMGILHGMPEEEQINLFSF